LFTFYSEKGTNLQRATDELEDFEVMGIGDKMEMLIHEVRERPVTERAILLDR
jgi:AMP phosphorylase